MIKENTIYFGYGDIAVYAIFNKIAFRQFKPTQECGTRIKEDVEWLSDPYYIKFNNLNEISEFRRYLIGIRNKDIKKIYTTSGTILNFENYNEKSVEVLFKHLKNVEKEFIFLMAA